MSYRNGKWKTESGPCLKCGCKVFWIQKTETGGKIKFEMYCHQCDEPAGSATIKAPTKGKKWAVKHSEHRTVGSSLPALAGRNDVTAEGQQPSYATSISQEKPQAEPATLHSVTGVRDT